MKQSRSEICARLQELQRHRAILIKSRIMQANRLQAIVAGTLGYHAGLAEKKRRQLFAEASKVIVAVVKEEREHTLASIIRVTQKGIDSFNVQQALVEKEMLRLAEALPVAAWMSRREQRGFGMLSMAVIVGEAGDIAGYATPGKLWKRFGCAPHEFEGKRLMGATWRSGREGRLTAEEWVRFGYSMRRRSILYVISESLLKGNQTGPYRSRYDQAKQAAQANHPEWKPLRCHRHAMLLMGKRLLLNLWRAWNHRPESESAADNDCPCAFAKC